MYLFFRCPWVSGLVFLFFGLFVFVVDCGSSERIIKGLLHNADCDQLHLSSRQRQKVKLLNGESGFDGRFNWFNQGIERTILICDGHGFSFFVDESEKDLDLACGWLEDKIKKIFCISRVVYNRLNLLSVPLSDPKHGSNGIVFVNGNHAYKAPQYSKFQRWETDWEHECQIWERLNKDLFDLDFSSEEKKSNKAYSDSDEHGYKVIIMPAFSQVSGSGGEKLMTDVYQMVRNIFMKFEIVNIDLDSSNVMMYRGKHVVADWGCSISMLNTNRWSFARSKKYLRPPNYQNIPQNMFDLFATQSWQFFLMLCEKAGTEKWPGKTHRFLLDNINQKRFEGWVWMKQLLLKHGWEDVVNPKFLAPLQLFERIEVVKDDNVDLQKMNAWFALISEIFDEQWDQKLEEEGQGGFLSKYPAFFPKFQTNLRWLSQRKYTVKFEATANESFLSYFGPSDGEKKQGQFHTYAYKVDKIFADIAFWTETVEGENRTRVLDKKMKVFDLILPFVGRDWPNVWTDKGSRHQVSVFPADRDEDTNNEYTTSDSTSDVNPTSDSETAPEPSPGPDANSDEAGTAPDANSDEAGTAPEPSPGPDANSDEAGTGQIARNGNPQGTQVNRDTTLNCHRKPTGCNSKTPNKTRGVIVWVLTALFTLVLPAVGCCVFFTRGEKAASDIDLDIATDVEFPVSRCKVGLPVRSSQPIRKFQDFLVVLDSQNDKSPVNGAASAIEDAHRFPGSGGCACLDDSD